MAIERGGPAPTRADGPRRDPARVRWRVDRRPVPAGRRRRRDRGRSPRLGPRDAAVRHGAPVRVRRVRAAGRARGWPGGRATSTSSRRRSGGSSSSPASVPAGADVDPQMLDGRVDAAYADVAGRSIVFDYSADGIRRSIEASLERLGVDRIDIALIHDPDDHWEAAIGEAFPALARLREEGVIRAIGAGMNQSAMLARFAREGDFDVFLLAGRYTLLDQDALDELLPLCVERGIAVMIGGVMNSGDPRRSAAGRPVQLPGRPPRRSSIAPSGSPRPAPGTASRSRRRRSSSRSPIRRSRRWSPASVGRAPRRVPGAAAPSRSRPPCGTTSAPRASSRRCADPGMTARRSTAHDPVDAHHHFCGPGPGRLPVADRRARRDPAAVRARRPRAAPGRGRHRRDRPRPDPLEPRRDARVPRDGGGHAVHPRRRRLGRPDATRRSPTRSPGSARGPGGDRLVGIRHQVHDEPDPDWLLRADVRRGHRGRRRAPVSPTTSSSGPGSCRPPLDTARALPQVRFVLDHLAKPPIAATATLEPWARCAPPVRRAAQCRVQALRARHRGRLGGLDRRRPRRPSVDRARGVRAGAAAVRLGLAGLPVAALVRAGRRRRSAGPGRRGAHARSARRLRRRTRSTSTVSRR